MVPLAPIHIRSRPCRYCDAPCASATLLNFILMWRSTCTNKSVLKDAGTQESLSFVQLNATVLNPPLRSNPGIHRCQCIHSSAPAFREFELIHAKANRETVVRLSLSQAQRMTFDFSAAAGELVVVVGGKPVNLSSTKVAQVLFGMSTIPISRSFIPPRRGLPERLTASLRQHRQPFAPSAMLFERVIYACRSAPPGIGNGLTRPMRCHSVSSTSDVCEDISHYQGTILACARQASPDPDRHRLRFHSPRVFFSTRKQNVRSPQLSWRDQILFW